MASYEFPIKGGTDEWKKLDSHSDMLEVCQIPKALVKKMKTAELVETVLNYPLYGDIYAYNNLEDGLKAITTQFNGMSELLTRDDAGKELLAKYKKISPLEVQNINDNLEKGNFALKLGFLETLLSSDKVISSLTDTQKDDLREESIQKQKQKLDQRDVFGLSLDTSKKFIDKLTKTKNFTISSYYTYVYTPKGTAVQVLADRTEMTSSEILSAYSYIRIYYPNATVLAEPTNKYNCHSYAWYWMSTSNIYWMNDPSAYMTDGSSLYLGTTPGIFISGLRMYYPGEHSAYMTARSPSTSTSYSDITCTSKWGSLPLMSHKADYCPYTSTTIKFYNLS